MECLASMLNCKRPTCMGFRTLIAEGVGQLENRVGKPLEDMTRAVVLNVISIVISGVSSVPP